VAITPTSIQKRLPVYGATEPDTPAPPVGWARGKLQKFKPKPHKITERIVATAAGGIPASLAVYGIKKGIEKELGLGDEDKEDDEETGEATIAEGVATLPEQTTPLVVAVDDETSAKLSTEILTRLDAIILTLQGILDRLDAPPQSISTPTVPGATSAGVTR